MKATPAQSTESAEVRAVRRRPLGAFFAPRAIAVIGATARPGSVGRSLLVNLAGYGGPVFPVNPKHAHVLQQPAYPSIKHVLQPVDLALIATPAASVPGIVRECVEAGVKAAIIHSAGFRECGPEGAAREREVFAAARQGGLRILGPNCLGLMAPHLRLNATFAATLAKPGSVAFISQSGALCTAVLDWSLRENVGLSAMVSVGAMGDVGWSDLIADLGDDPRTRSILLYMETVGNARAFLSAAREVAFSKPIIVVKAGRTSSGSQAAATHSGALTGSDAVVDAAFRRVGVLRVDTIEDLFDMAEVLGKQPRPAGPRLGMVTNAGGPTALAADRLVLGGGKLAVLDGKTIAGLNQVLPAHWSHGNPVDVLGDADEERFARAIELVTSDPGTDGVLVVLTPQAMTDPLAIAQRVKAVAGRRPGKPILASWMGAAAVEAGEAELNGADVPTFKYPDRAAQAFNYMWQYSANLAALYETPVRRGAVDGEAQQSVRRPVAEARQRGHLLLTESESKEVLAAYGIPVVATFPAKSEDEAVELAAKIGYPVAFKLHSETVTHKADVGGVRLNIRNGDEAREAWRSIRQAVTERVGGQHFLGVSVQRMVSSEGFEFILGSSVDPQFGPVLVFGAGGRLVEVIRDQAIALPPLNSTLARRLMEQSRIYGALQPRPGRPAVDLAALEEVVVRFSHLVAEVRGIKEIDINPLLASAGEIVALDARIVLHEAGLADEQLPRLAIRPYPHHYAASHTLKDGTPMLLRSIRPEDEPLLVKFHEGLSDQSVYFRYFTPLSLAQRTTHARLARLCFIDYDRETAVVAVHDETSTGHGEIVGVGRLCRSVRGNEAEFALVVSDAWQQRGVGTLLLQKLIEIGREERLGCIRGMILYENIGMRRLCEKVGFNFRLRAAESAWEATITP